ncbi:MAG: hypothetical protein ACYC35_20540 [Pirellulales bacterium]
MGRLLQRFRQGAWRVVAQLPVLSSPAGLEATACWPAFGFPVRLARVGPGLDALPAPFAR